MDGIIEFDLIKNQASNIIKVIGVGGAGDVFKKIIVNLKQN